MPGTSGEPQVSKDSARQVKREATTALTSSSRDPRQVSGVFRSYPTRANTRTVRAIHGRPVDLLDTDRQAMTELPPTAPRTGLTHRIRLARDYYVRVDTCDYSVDPRVIGRFIEVSASPTTVEVFCDRQLVARHLRSWATHEVITAARGQRSALQCGCRVLPPAGPHG